MMMQVEAREKWCPFFTAYCYADECMMWRWTDTHLAAIDAWMKAKNRSEVSNAEMAEVSEKYRNGCCGLGGR